MEKDWANPINEKSKRQGNLLRNIRGAAGLTMRQLAMQVGISHTAISQLEHGKLEVPYSRMTSSLGAGPSESTVTIRICGRRSLELAGW